MTSDRRRATGDTWKRPLPHLLVGGRALLAGWARDHAPARAEAGGTTPSSRRQILQLFRQIAEAEGTTILIASHDLAVDAFADQVHHLQDGRIVNSWQ